MSRFSVLVSSPELAHSGFLRFWVHIFPVFNWSVWYWCWVKGVLAGAVGMSVNWAVHIRHFVNDQVLKCFVISLYVMNIFYFFIKNCVEQLLTTQMI